MSSYKDDYEQVLELAPDVAEAAREIRKGWDARTLESRSVLKNTPYLIPTSTIMPTELEDPTYKDLY